MITMEEKDWYRKTTWSAEDKEDFFAHLSTSSAEDKRHYLRTQAHYLQNKADPPDYESALSLLEYLVRESSDITQMALALVQKARCLESLGKTEEALEAYRGAVEFSRNEHGSYTTDAPLHFAIFVVGHRLLAHYNEVLESLGGTEPLLIVPLPRYMICAALALIADDTGMTDKAKEYSIHAVETIESHSIPRKDLDESIYQRVRQLSGR